MLVMQSIKMSMLLLQVAYLIVPIIHLSDGKQTFACGTKTNQCLIFKCQCQPGERIEIIRAYDVVKNSSLRCQENVPRCTQTYKSNCCSGVADNDVTFNFTTSRIDTVKDHCDNKQICSDTIFTHTTSLQVIEYNCKGTPQSTYIPSLVTEYETSTQKPASPKEVQITIVVPCVGVVLLVGTVTLIYCLKRDKERTSPEPKQREVMYDYVEDIPFKNRRVPGSYSNTAVGYSEDGHSVYNHLNEAEPRVEGIYDTTASTMAYLQKNRIKGTDEPLHEGEELYNHIGAAQERIVVVDNIYNTVQIPIEESQC